MRTNIDQLEYTPLNRFTQHGNEIQFASVTVEGVEIFERIYFPYNFMKNISVLHIVQLILPLNNPYPLQFNGKMNYDLGYYEDGYGSPIFNELEDAVAFVEFYNDNKDLFYETNIERNTNS